MPPAALAVVDATGGITYRGYRGRESSQVHAHPADGVVYALVNEMIERHHPDYARKEITNNFCNEPVDDLLDALRSVPSPPGCALLRDTLGRENDAG